jgi:hypothetical protein
MQVLASLPEIHEPSLVLPGLGPVCGLLDSDPSFWEEFLSEEARASHQQGPPATHEPNLGWRPVLPVDHGSNSINDHHQIRLQHTFNRHFQGLIAANSGVSPAPIQMVGESSRAAMESHHVLIPPSKQSNVEILGYLGAMIPYDVRQSSS